MPKIYKVLGRYIEACHPVLHLEALALGYPDIRNQNSLDSEPFLSLFHTLIFTSGKYCPYPSGANLIYTPWMVQAMSEARLAKHLNMDYSSLFTSGLRVLAQSPSSSKPSIFNNTYPFLDLQTRLGYEGATPNIQAIYRRRFSISSLRSCPPTPSTRSVRRNSTQTSTGVQASADSWRPISPNTFPPRNTGSHVDEDNSDLLSRAFIHPLAEEGSASGVNCGSRSSTPPTVLRPTSSLRSSRSGSAAVDSASEEDGASSIRPPTVPGIQAEEESFVDGCEFCPRADSEVDDWRLFHQSWVQMQEELTAYRDQFDSPY